MQTLAAGVGDLKRVLTNVKSRGTFGEVQLAALLEQVLTPEQYATNVATRPGSNERVEFAIRMPGRDDGSRCGCRSMPSSRVEDYERLLAAHERADRRRSRKAGRALETRIRTEAKTHRARSTSPRRTPPTSASCSCRPRACTPRCCAAPASPRRCSATCAWSIAGPTTLFAMLNSLQMGFRTLAIEKRSREVWQVLGAVKTEFGKFGEVLATLKKQLAPRRTPSTGPRRARARWARH
jgi:DNA recombination protein RmuC